MESLHSGRPGSRRGRTPMSPAADRSVGARAPATPTRGRTLESAPAFRCWRACPEPTGWLLHDRAVTGTGAIAEHLLVGPFRLVLGNHPTANGQLALNHEGRWWDASAPVQPERGPAGVGRRAYRRPADPQLPGDGWLTWGCSRGWVAGSTPICAPRSTRRAASTRCGRLPPQALGSRRVDATAGTRHQRPCCDGHRDMPPSGRR